MTSDHEVHLRNINHESELNYIRKIEHQRVVDYKSSRDFYKENESDQMHPITKEETVRVLRDMYENHSYYKLR